MLNQKQSDIEHLPMKVVEQIQNDLMKSIKNVYNPEHQEIMTVDLAEASHFKLRS